MATTRTGHFPIGFLNNLGHWQSDLVAAAQFAKTQHFESIDLVDVDLAQLPQITDLGVAIGTINLKQPWTDLVSGDPAKRRAAAEVNAQFIHDAVSHGVRHFFTVIIPEDPTAPRTENLDRAVDGYGRLCEAIHSSGARIVVEGWPGTYPYYSHLACTPEGCRTLMNHIGNDSIGINFDPSHLIRMGIDPIRFLDEFAPRVYHMHAKDTELLDDGLYEFGNLQPAIHAQEHGCGGHHWRYCIPGHGIVRWGKLLSMLLTAGYDGRLSIELEDENFLDTPKDQQHGLVAARDFLLHV